MNNEMQPLKNIQISIGYDGNHDELCWEWFQKLWDEKKFLTTFETVQSASDEMINTFKQRQQ